jgi:hypothetical protein
MKSRGLTLFTIAAFLAPTVSVGLAQAQQPQNNPPHYTAIDLGTLGGTFRLRPFQSKGL